MSHFSWARLLAALASVKVVVAVAGFALLWANPAAAPTSETALSPWVLLAAMLAFASAGAWLATAGRGDRRALHLGVFFLLLATPFANRPLLLLAGSLPPVAAALPLALRNLAVDAFFPFLLWLFVAEFPDGVTTHRVQRALLLGRRLALGVGAFLAVWQAVWLPWALTMAPAGASPAEAAPPKPSYEFYGPLMLLAVPALALLFARARRATGVEGRRARVFTAGLALGLAPLFLQIVLEAGIAPYREWMDGGSRRFWVANLLLFPALFSVPFTTAYAVAVHQILDVRLIARRALHYALARGTALGLALIPLAALGLYFWAHREQPLVEIFSGARLPLVAAAAAIGVAALRYRRGLLDAVDRRFFREQYDARRILTLLLERIRSLQVSDELAGLLAREIDLALHLEGVALLVADPRSGMLVDPRRRVRRLDASSPLAGLIADASEPLAVSLQDSRSPLAHLDEPERHWLVDSGFRLIVPVLGRDGSLLGLIGLGEKRSGLPFLREDRELLRAIASSAAWVLELERSRSLGTASSGPSTGQPPLRAGEAAALEPAAAGAEAARECPGCGQLFPSYTVFCAECSRRLDPAHVPFVLPGKFRFERRLGAGGMGVVYRGSDLSLGRSVAVKTLRRVSPEDALRLRREARTAAAVSHPRLAGVYGMETWQGTPMLVLELLEGGTLSERISRGPLEVVEALDLGIAMADALEHLHASDVLHRDIKPSNIGYTRDGIPKLMDFGIARAMFDHRGEAAFHPLDDPAQEEGLPPTSVWEHERSPLTGSHKLVGTLAYLSPEALNGDPPDTSFDLWSLAIVLYECLLGRRIFSGGDMQQMMVRIRHGRVPDFSQTLPEHEPRFGDFFRSALHRSPSRRPASAREMRERLQALRFHPAA